LNPAADQRDYSNQFGPVHGARSVHGERRTTEALAVVIDDDIAETLVGYLTSAITKIATYTHVDIGAAAQQRDGATVLITINNIQGYFITGNVNEAVATLSQKELLLECPCESA
jgi:hypothetical protein